jgi:hypothetical protein
MRDPHRYMVAALLAILVLVSSISAILGARESAQQRMHDIHSTQP